MKIFRRLTLLGSFSAVGVGLALCVGFSNAPLSPPGTEPSAQLVGTTTHVDKADCGEQPDRCDLSAPAGRHTVDRGPINPIPAVPTSPIIAQPYPALAAQAVPQPADPSLMKVVDYLMTQIDRKSAPATPEQVPPGQPAPQRPATAGSAPPVAAPAAPRIRADQGISPTVPGEGDNRLKINFPDIDIREALEMLSEQGDLNILASSNVQGKVSATLKDVDVESALDAILKATGYVARRDGKFIYVGTADDFQTMEQLMDKIGTRIYHPNYVQASELQTLLTPLLTEKVGAISVTTATETGIGSDDSQAGGDSYAGGDAVLVRDYEAVLTQIDQVVSAIDVRPPQVHIEAMILSVKLKDEDEFGVDFEFLRDNDSIKFGWGEPLDSLATFKFEKGALKFGYLDGELGAFLKALETIGDTNVIASPRLLVLNKHRAEIQIGEQKGYVNTTVTETSSTESVEFLDIGTLLRLRPYVSSDGLIRMAIHPELSDGDVKEKGGFTLPEKVITQVTTNIMVRDGCTVVIGGLMREQLATTTSQVPLFGNLPVVGAAFRTKLEKIERDEVIVLITPRIVYEPETCQEGDKAACEFHRRQRAYCEKMSPFGKRAIAARYFRQAQQAWATGNAKSALRLAEMAVYFDPLNRAAVDLRADIWQGNRFGDHMLNGPVPDGGPVNPLEGTSIAPWLLDDLERDPEPQTVLLHPLDPGQPGRHQDIERPRRLE